MGHTPRTNHYGIEFSIHEIARCGNRYCESGMVLDVQVKSTTRSVAGLAAIGYDLEAKAYADLRDPDARNARLLVLVVFPKDPTGWLIQTEEELILRGCA
jgi:hypothetical protein